MQRKVSENDNTTLLGEEQTQHMKEYISTAETIFSNASVYTGSVSGTVIGNRTDVANLTSTFGSVLGIDDDYRRRINQWVPGEGILEGLAPRFPLLFLVRSIFQFFQHSKLLVLSDSSFSGVGHNHMSIMALVPPRIACHNLTFTMCWEPEPLSYSRTTRICKWLHVTR